MSPAHLEASPGLGNPAPCENSPPEAHKEVGGTEDEGGGRARRVCRGHREHGEGRRWPEGASTAGPGVWEGGRWGRNEGESQSGSWGMGGGPGSLWLPSSREPPEPPAVLPRPRPAPPARPGRSPGLIAGEHPGGPGCPPDTPASSSCPCRPCGGCHISPPGALTTQFSPPGTFRFQKLPGIRPENSPLTTIPPPAAPPPTHPRAPSHCRPCCPGRGLRALASPPCPESHCLSLGPGGRLWPPPPQPHRRPLPGAP